MVIALCIKQFPSNQKRVDMQYFIVYDLKSEYGRVVNTTETEKQRKNFRQEIILRYKRKRRKRRGRRRQKRRGGGRRRRTKNIHLRVCTKIGDFEDWVLFIRTSTTFQYTWYVFNKASRSILFWKICRTCRWSAYAVFKRTNCLCTQNWSIFTPCKNCWATESSKHASNNRITDWISALLGNDSVKMLKRATIEAVSQ
jgi:hypothetical protein